MADFIEIRSSDKNTPHGSGLDEIARDPASEDLPRGDAPLSQHRSVHERPSPVHKIGLPGRFVGLHRREKDFGSPLGGCTRPKRLQPPRRRRAGLLPARDGNTKRVTRPAASRRCR